MSESNYISIKGAKVNNLKNIDVNIPRNKLVVITGLSGSGKSSLAFDTLYAEGQRRYVESLSSYARQFLGRMSKPECDFIKGIPPAIAIEQKVTSRNPRSTVGTSTEIYEYLRLLFARVGKTYSPVSGQIVKKDSAEDIVNCMLSYPNGTRYTVLTPIVPREGRDVQQQIEMDRKEGFTRLEVNGEMVRMEDYAYNEADTIYLLIDRMSCDDSKDSISRLTDSAETAMYEGDGACLLRFYTADGETRLHSFSTKFEADGITFTEPIDQMFSFNSPIGACPVCEGFGKIVGIDEHLVVPNRALSVYDGAVMCWRGEKMGEWLHEFLREAPAHNFPIFAPYYELTEEQKDYLWHGPRDKACIDSFFKMLEENQYKIQYRVMLARYRGKTVCPACHGSRLKKEALYVKVGGKNIAEIVSMPINDVVEFFRTLKLDEHDTAVAARLLNEIGNRLKFLQDVGLGYLTLNRLSNTLSGGESQRINLATSLGSSLVGSLYILDEPSIGLHQRDNDKLLGTLTHLRDLGNSVIVVEHDEDTMFAADYIVDIGPGAGRNGGEVVATGTAADIMACKDSLTGAYLSGRIKIPVPAERRKPAGWIKVRGARENNLKNIDVDIPLGVVTCVTGVSGSGKSSLVNEILYKHLAKSLNRARCIAGDHDGIDGIEQLDKVINIDQSPIGRTPRSNPATYTGVFDMIRDLFATTKDAKERGYTKGRFSFNVKGGRCEACSGDGIIKIEMHFLPDVYVPCEVCEGKRYNRETLEVKYKDKSIYDVLDMTIEDAVDFFENVPSIRRKIETLNEVGLSYVKLGQPSTELSGGEAQRIKLATELSRRSTGKTIYILDEPTTGLHFADVHKLVNILHRLAEGGNTVVVIEHNLDVIKTADYIIDMGPEGGDRGGTVIAKGTPEEIVKVKKSYTGQYVKKYLEEK